MPNTYTMRAAVLTAIGEPLEVMELELVPLQPHRVLIRTHASPFCSTDCLNAAGGLGKEPPTILGHASVGVVEAVGSAVSKVRVGQRVVVPGTPECGVCFYCAEGRTDQCSELFDATFPHEQLLAAGTTARQFPVVANLPSGEGITAAGNIGGYAEMMNVTENHAFPVETDLSDEVLSLLGCGILTGVGSIFNVAQVRPGTSVAIVGAGHLGLWMTQAARIAGASRIIVVEPIAERREVALELGATHVVDPAHGDVVEQVKELTDGRGADYGLEAAGPASAQRDAFLMTRRAGRVVFLGVEHFTAEVALPQVALAIGGRDVMSSQNGRVRMRRDIPRYIRMLEAGVLRPEPIITSRYALDDINVAVDAAASHRDLSGVFVLA